MAPLARALQTVRSVATLAPVRPAYAAGLRAAIATVAPLALAAALGLGAGTWMSIGGFTGALSDRGGTYRSRAATMLALMASSACTVVLGTLAGAHIAAALPITFAVAFATSLARVWGSAGVGVGLGSLSAFVIALATPEHNVDEAIARAGWVILGGAWAMVVALVLWPLRPYRPARLAVAAAYRALASFVDELARAVAAGAADDRAMATRVIAVRLALENARGVLARMRRGRPGGSGRGERFVALGDIVDGIFGHLVAVGEYVESIPPAARDDAAQREVTAALGDLASRVRAIADAVEGERAAAPVRAALDVAALRARALELRATAGDEVTTHYLHAATVLHRAADYASAAALAVEGLDSGREAPASPARPEVDEPEAPSPLATVLAVLSPGSVMLRYALRVAVVTTTAVALAALLALPHGYWITITVIVILQPYTGATTRRALERVIGTVLGGLLTAGLGAFLHDSRAILVLAFVFTAVCVALLPLNYAAFSVFLTPTFVLLAEASAGDWDLAGTRVVNTLLGGLLALLGARVLWPSPEWTRLPGYIAAALRANRDHLRAVVELFDDRSERAGQTLRAARRGVGLATVNMDESFQRLLGEHGDDSATVASALTFLTYTRRLTGANAALALARHAPSDRDAGAAIAGFARAAVGVLDDLALAVTEHRAPAPVPDSLEGRTGALPPLLQARVDRIARQVVMLHGAATRWAAGEATGEYPVPARRAS